MKNVLRDCSAADIDTEDILFKIIKASGSLDEIVESYRGSYPSGRLRLDRLIRKILSGGGDVWHVPDCV
jgi:hypothetical protein